MSRSRTTNARHRLARLALLPLPERLFVLLLLGCALCPALARGYAAVAGAADFSPLASLGRATWLACAASAVVAFVALLALEPPRSWRPRAYAAQLRARLSSAQSHYDAARRRRFPEENHHEDDEAVPR